MWTSRGVPLMLTLAGFAQGAETPTLTEAQRWQLTALTQRLELAQLRAQIAQRDFDAAKSELIAVAKKLEREGFELDLATMAYKPARMPQEPRPAPELTPDSAKP